MRSRPLVTTGALAATVSVLIVLLYAGRIGMHLGDPGVLGMVGVLVLLAVAGVAAWAGSVTVRVRGQVRHVDRRRPGAPLVVGRPTAALTVQARALRAGTRGLPPDAADGERVVYAVLPDRVELWVRGDDSPRWWVTLPGEVSEGSVRVGRSDLDALTVRDATAALQVVPTSLDAKAWPSRADRAAAVERTRALLAR